jgi:hypothetical protein
MKKPARRKRRSRRPQLYILGAGVAFPEHLTVETIEILTACGHIYANLPQARLRGLPQDIRVKCKSLWHLYRDGRPRSENYKDTVHAIVAAVTKQRAVAWLVPGHPVVFDSVTQALLQESRKRRWQTRLIPAISCLDTMLAELGYDPSAGLLIHDATSLVKGKIALMPEAATFLFQPAVFGSHLTHTSPHYRGQDLKPLRDYLRKFYAADHACAFVRSAATRDGGPETTWVKLADLAATPFAAVAGSTLYLSAVKRASR